MNLQNKQLETLASYVKDSKDKRSEYLLAHCSHAEAVYDDLDVCPTCGITMEEYYVEQAEDRLDDEAREEYYIQKYGDL